VTIIEAIKSGKPFKRGRWPDDSWLYAEGKAVFYLKDDKHAYFSDPNDFTASDYEIKQEPREWEVWEYDNTISSLPWVIASSHQGQKIKVREVIE